MKKPYHALVFVLSAVSITFLSCSTAKISINKNEFQKVNTIAIMEFDRSPGIDRSVAIECEEAFRGHFIDIGKSVVERNKMSSILKEIEQSQTGIIQNADEIGRLSGAQALLFGQVTRNSEEIRWVDYKEYVKNPVTKKTETIIKKKKMKFFTFQVQARLISTVNGTTVMTIMNEHPERSYEMTDSMTLTRYRAYVLERMGKDLAKIIKKKD